jgi:LEA14-like dessication related protein
MQADLINTKFKAGLRINNPNGFAVDLSSMDYELYGNGSLWAAGKEKPLLHIPAQSSGETEISFSMNFIGMSRRLLDDIIALRRVSYRFSGTTEIETGIPYFPSFCMRFDCKGDSDVVR